jgi:AcrR family transcriptional regulator
VDAPIPPAVATPPTALALAGDAVRRRPGLRARKRARTHELIREQALRLFLAQGYEATTVQQIADAADVSLSTVFRYFPTKAQLVLPFDLATLIRDALARLRPDETVFDAIRDALRASFAELGRLGGEPGSDDMAPYPVARAREALLGQATGLVGLIAAFVGERWGRDPHDPLVQSASGGVVGVLMAAWAADRDLGRTAALRILDVGLQGLEDGFRP